MSNSFQRNNSWKLLGRSKFKSKWKNKKVKNCRKNWVSCSYLFDASLFIFKQIKFLWLKNSFKCEKSNLSYAAVCQGCKGEYMDETGCLVKALKKIYRHIR